MIKRTLLGATAVAATLMLAACGSSTDNASDTTSGETSSTAGAAANAAGADLDLVDDGTLTVCSDVPYAPFEDFDKSSDLGFKGFDIDIDNQIATDLGLKLKVLDQDFDGLQSGLTLNAGTCDLVSSALTITDDRAKHLAFSDGYYDSEQSLLVPADSSIASLDDLKGKTVGVQKGTTGKAYATEHVTGANIPDFPSDAEMFLALKAGQVDALLQDLPVNIEHTKTGDYKVVEKYSTGEEYGLAAKLGNDKLIEAVNSALAKMKSDGTYDTIYNKYFATN